MEASLSLLMANLSKVQKNMLVIDPFVGTGEFFISMITGNSIFWGLSIKDIKIEHQLKQIHVCNTRIDIIIWMLFCRKHSCALCVSPSICHGNRYQLLASTCKRFVNTSLDNYYSVGIGSNRKVHHPFMENLMNV